MKGPVRDLSSFAEALRHRGLTVTPDQVGDMARSISLVDAAERSQVYSALRSLAITDPDQRIPFDEVFTEFFEADHSPLSDADTQSRLAMATEMTPVIRSLEAPHEAETRSQSGASASEKIAGRDFADLDDDELAEARRLVMSMMWQPRQPTDLTMRSPACAKCTRSMGATLRKCMTASRQIMTAQSHGPRQWRSGSRA